MDFPGGEDTRGFRIRERRLGDLLGVVRILREGFPGWYRRIPYLVFRTIVAEREGRPAGFVCMPMRKGTGEIGIIAVSSCARRLGMGGALLRAALASMRAQGMKRCVAKVRPDNPAAQRMFSREGFSRVGMKKRRRLGNVHLVERGLEGEAPIARP